MTGESKDDQEKNETGLFNDCYNVSDKFSKASYVPSILFLILACVLPFIGRLVGESMISSYSGAGGFEGLYWHADSLNKATTVMATFDVIAIVVGIVGVILLIKTFRANLNNKN